jgi:hypothetical protein
MFIVHRRTTPYQDIRIVPQDNYSTLPLFLMLPKHELLNINWRCVRVSGMSLVTPPLW